MKLQCDEDGLLIQKGWKKFQKNNQLENGEYLVFRYDGALQFTIRIFSKNGLERQVKSTNMVENQQASIDGGSKRKRPEKFPKKTCANGENETGIMIHFQFFFLLLKVSIKWSKSDQI